MNRKKEIFSDLLERMRIFANGFSFWFFFLLDQNKQKIHFFRKLIKKIARMMRILMIGSILFSIRYIYRIAILPWLHGDCRFHPTCSEYAIQAFQQHALFRAIILVLWRIARCHPWGKCGHDPIPPSLFSSS